MKSIKIIVFTLLVNLGLSIQAQKLENGIFAKIETKKGEILIQLEYQKTPMTVANFISLTEGTNKYVLDKYKGKRFYDGLKFHRVIKNFMIQGGDPTGTGAGSIGYKFKDEFDDSLKHDRAGILSMANSGPSTNASQFFITHKATPWLNGKHTVFGHVLNGQDVVDAIEEKDIIKSITIIRKGKEAKKFNASEYFSESMKKEKEVKERELLKKKKIIADILDKESKAEILDSGLKIYTVEAGLGKKPKAGDRVKIHYTGYLRNGKKIDSSKDRNRPFTTPIGVGRVIKGWDEGIQQLRVGTKAILYIPANLAYGRRGAGNVIPPKANLIFEIELLEIMN